jgi:hypothetical protein
VAPIKKPPSQVAFFHRPKNYFLAGSAAGAAAGAEASAAGAGAAAGAEASAAGAGAAAAGAAASSFLPQAAKAAAAITAARTRDLFIVNYLRGLKIFRKSPRQKTDLTKQNGTEPFHLALNYMSKNP